MKRFSKLIGTVLGGITGATVTAVAGWFGLDLPPELAAAVAVLLAAAGAYLAPANTPAGGR